MNKRFFDIKLENGDLYEGLFKNDLYNGYGIFINKKTDYYQGIWLNGKRNGYGI